MDGNIDDIILGTMFWGGVIVTMVGSKIYTKWKQRKDRSRGYLLLDSKLYGTEKKISHEDHMIRIPYGLQID